MTVISVNRQVLYGKVYNDVRCLSTDEKPSEGILNGSTLVEIDTGKKYLYNASSGAWMEVLNATFDIGHDGVTL